MQYFHELKSKTQGDGNGSMDSAETEVVTRRRVRLIDVAQEVGVSVQVVSKVLNGGTSNVGASEQTRQRVKEVARRLGYRRHAAGMALRSQAFRSVGLLMGDAVRENTFLPQGILAGLTQAVAEADYTINLMAAGQLIGETVRDSRLLNEQMVDVLLIAQATEPSNDLIESIRYMPTPVLWLHRQVQVNAVAFDEHAAAMTLVEHLANGGARTIHYLDLNANPAPAVATRLRRQGFSDACQRLRIEPRPAWDQRVERPRRGEFLATWLKQQTEPAAVIVDSCTAAMTLLDVALAQGLNVPESLKIVTYDNGTLCTASSPAISAMIYPELQLGRTAGDMAIKLAQNSQSNLPGCVLSCTFNQGGTS